MKVINDLGKFRKVVLWKNELPSHPKEADHELEISLQLTKPIVSENKELAVELKLPRNSSYYALLGLEFTPNQTSELRIKIKIKNSSDDLYDSELELNEEIYLGIPSEYANSIINSAKEVLLESSWQHSGSITFTLGAHSLIGSSEAVFSKVTKVLVALLENELSLGSSLSDRSIILSEMDK
ncbi:hypothetical protein [Paenibacillus pabuli]|uniref:hypothetical protein n=1 Tax=Paenibacillus pabuli TaxID=1472 RepID=UPI000785E074|nr:hypothetical protein [Paenibacillus pabuli]MEC0128991.1 hypothetical protein [Paenibacillus pabuli]